MLHRKKAAKHKTSDAVKLESKMPMDIVDMSSGIALNLQTSAHTVAWTPYTNYEWRGGFVRALPSPSKSSIIYRRMDPKHKQWTTMC